MRAVLPQYPVDRYLVDSSKKIEMVNIIDDDIWNSEPALKPEDEIMLRKLHEMLQSTADDLKLLSGELSKFHEPGVQMKSMPTPLDEEFNEKVHIEEVVNAKFHGYKVIDKSPRVPDYMPKNDVVGAIKSIVNKSQKPTIINRDAHVNTASTHRKETITKKLGLSRTKIVQINEINPDFEKNEKLNNGKVINTSPAVAYNEFSFKYVEPKVKEMPKKVLHLQEMPSINIRSELKEQKVLHLDILPENKDNEEIINTNKNVAVVTLQHDTTPQQVKNVPTKIKELVQNQQPDNNKPARKVSKMSTCESSESTNNISSDVQMKLKIHKRPNNTIRFAPKTSGHNERNKKSKAIDKKETEKRSHLNLDEWKKKLNSVYGQSSTPTSSKKPKSNINKISPKKTNLPASSRCKLSKANNNAEYIPYSQLTLGGVRVSDIEKEISNIPNKKDIPLSPILDKILSSRENSFSTDNPRKSNKKVSSNVLTTSDENLLQEVIDIEMTVSETLSRNLKIDKPALKSQNASTESRDNDSYADDFEDEKSDEQKHASNTPSDDNKTDNEDTLTSDDNAINRSTLSKTKSKIQDTTFTKVSSLSFKNSVDIFEFVHSIDTQDTATQSNTSLKLPSETQTSPRNDRPNIQPIHNDLWPTIDPKGEVEKMFKLEKDFIKQLIVNEYGDLLEKNISKPSTSKHDTTEIANNVSSSQKNTQTSPAHVKSVMTSPTRTKTRMTSPFPVSSKVDHQTSPLFFVTNEENKVEIEFEEDLGISVNLSSPRFSLRLPQSSREVLSNLEDKSCPKRNSKDAMRFKTFRNPASNSTSIDADNSSSELSSLGEIKLKLKRKLKKNRIPSLSESSSSSLVSRYSSDISGGVLPLRSDGEISLGQRPKKVLNKPGKSDGEMSLGLK